MAQTAKANIREARVKNAGETVTVQIGGQVLHFREKGPSASGKSVTYFPVEDPSGRPLELTDDKGNRVQLSVRVNVFN